jgi:hypothetical protein
MTDNEIGQHDALERLARRLGEREAAAIDPAAMARRVGARLREPVPQPRRLRMRWWVPLAAAATLILAVGVGLQMRGNGAGTDVAAVPAEIADLDADELEEVLDSLAVDVPLSELVSVGLYELTETELATLLETMEG